jgi:1,4-dihydroxy-2-naphthoate octaprenyltransferase
LSRKPSYILLTHKSAEKYADDRYCHCPSVLINNYTLHCVSRFISETLAEEYITAVTQTMKSYVRSLRAPFLAGSIVPVVIGAATAFTAGAFSFPSLLVTAAGVAALHLAANLLNDYYDAAGSDPVNVRLTPFSGGSRVIQNSEVPPWAILFMAIFFFILGTLAGIWLVSEGRPLVIVIGLLGLFAGWAYSAPPFQLMGKGWGETVIFFAFGPLVTLGTHYVIAGHLSLTAFLMGIPQGFFITSVIWINQFPDYEADKKAGKANLVVRMGPAPSRYAYCAMMIAAFITIIIMIAGGEVSFLTMFSFIAFPLAFKAMRILWKEYLSHEGIVPAQALTIQTLIAHGLLLSFGLFLGKALGV